MVGGQHGPGLPALDEHLVNEAEQLVRLAFQVPDLKAPGHLLPLLLPQLSLSTGETPALSRQSHIGIERAVAHQVQVESGLRPPARLGEPLDSRADLPTGFPCHQLHHAAELVPEHHNPAVGARLPELARHLRVHLVGLRGGAGVEVGAEADQPVQRLELFVGRGAGLL